MTIDKKTINESGTPFTGGDTTKMYTKELYSLDSLGLEGFLDAHINESVGILQGFKEMLKHEPESKVGQEGVEYAGYRVLFAIEELRKKYGMNNKGGA